jgi:outer membrane protein OmpA-like peptidoglycan-associated protein
VKRIVFCLFLFGCSPYVLSTNKIYNEERIKKLPCIAVFPFNNKTIYPDAGFLVSEGVAEFIKKTQKGVMTPSEVKKFLEGKGVIMPSEIDTGTAIAIGRLIGAMGILHGEVTEFLVDDKGWSKEPKISFSVVLFDINGKRLFEGKTSVNVEFYNGAPVFSYSELIERSADNTISKILPLLNLKKAPCVWRKIKLVKKPVEKPPEKKEEKKLEKSPEELLVEKLLRGEKVILEGLRFKKDSFVPEEGIEVVAVLGKFLKDNEKMSITIVGHSSEDEKNPTLSLLRALYIAKILYKDFQLEQGRVKVKGAGSAEPLDPKIPERNRRVEVFITK